MRQYTGYRCLHILLLGFKYGHYCNVHIAIILVPGPIRFLTFTRAIDCTSASTAILCFAAFHIWNIALLVAANTHLCDIFHLFVFLVQAGAGNAVPVEFNQSVHVERHLFYFRPTNKCLGLVKHDCDVLFHVPSTNSHLLGTIIIAFQNRLRSIKQ